MLSINGALSKSGPALGVIIILVWRVGGSSGDIVLKSAEVGEEVRYSHGAFVIYCCQLSQLKGP